MCGPSQVPAVNGVDDEKPPDFVYVHQAVSTESYSTTSLLSLGGLSPPGPSYDIIFSDARVASLWVCRSRDWGCRYGQILK